jgi:hypothetical protein
VLTPLVALLSLRILVDVPGELVVIRIAHIREDAPIMTMLVQDALFHGVEAPHARKCGTLAHLGDIVEPHLLTGGGSGHDDRKEAERRTNMIAKAYCMLLALDCAMLAQTVPIGVNPSQLAPMGYERARNSCWEGYRFLGPLTENMKWEVGGTK